MESKGYSTSQLEQLYTEHFRKMAKGGINGHQFYKLKEKNIPKQPEPEIKLTTESAAVVDRNKADLKNPNYRSPPTVFRGRRKAQVLKGIPFEDNQPDIFTD